MILRRLTGLVVLVALAGCSANEQARQTLTRYRELQGDVTRNYSEQARVALSVLEREATRRVIAEAKLSALGKAQDGLVPTAELARTLDEVQAGLSEAQKFVAVKRALVSFLDVQSVQERRYLDLLGVYLSGERPIVELLLGQAEDRIPDGLLGTSQPETPAPAPEKVEKP